MFWLLLTGSVQGSGKQIVRSDSIMNVFETQEAMGSDQPKVSKVTFTDDEEFIAAEPVEDIFAMLNMDFEDYYKPEMDKDA